MSYKDHECKLNYLKKLLPRFETGLIESPCIRAAILRFIKSHNIKIEIFELSPESGAQCKNSDPCYKLNESPCYSSKKKVHFGTQFGNGNICHRILASHTHQSNDCNTRVVNSGTNVREEELNRNPNFKHSHVSCQVDNFNESQKLDKTTDQDLDQRKKSDCECQVSSYINASTMPVPTALPSQFPPTPNITLENSSQRSEFEENSSHNIQRGTSPEILRSARTPNLEQNRLTVPKISRTRPGSPSSIGGEDPIGTATSNEVILNDEVSEALEATPSQKLNVACECLFNRLAQKSPKHVELINNVIKRFENLMECEEQLQKKKKNDDESTIIGELISKLTSILQDSVEQYQLSGDIRKAQSLRTKNENIEIEQFRPRSASSRRNSPISEILNSVAFDFNDPNNETVVKSRDQIRPDLSEIRPDPGGDSKGFLSLQSTKNASKYVNGCRDKSQAAVSGSEASDSDDKVEAPMPQRIWKSSVFKRRNRSKSRKTSSTPTQSENSCSCSILYQSGGIRNPSDNPPEINIIQPSNEIQTGMTFSEMPSSYSSSMLHQQSEDRPSEHRSEDVLMNQSFSTTPQQQNKVRPIQEKTMDESFSWLQIDSTCLEPETPKKQVCSPNLPQSPNSMPSNQPELTIRTSPDTAHLAGFICPAQNCTMGQYPTEDTLMDSSATSYMDLPCPRNVTTQPQVITQTTSTQCEPESSIMNKDESDKTVQTCENHDDQRMANKWSTPRCSKKSRLPVFYVNQRGTVVGPTNELESIAKETVTKINDEVKLNDRQEEICTEAGNVGQQNKQVEKIKEKKVSKENGENAWNKRRVTIESLSTKQNSNIVFYNKSQMRLIQEKRRQYK